MKGIIFNLLERAACEAGCSDEAWEVVVEFASVKLSLDGTSDSMDVFTFPAGAMLKCFSSDGEDDDRPELMDLHDQGPEWTVADEFEALIGEELDPFADQAACGFGPTAFADLDEILAEMLDVGAGWDAAEHRLAVETTDDEVSPPVEPDPWPLPRKP